MEDTQGNTLNFPYPGFLDIRQSTRWGDYLNLLGWQSITLNEGLTIRYKPNPIFGMAKIQRPKELDQSDLQKIDEVAKKQKFAFVKIEPAFKQDLDILVDGGYRAGLHPMAPPSTVIINLTKPTEELFQNLSRSAKYSYHRAIREGTVFETHTQPDSELLETIYKVCASVARKGKFYVLPKNLFFEKIKLWEDKCHIAIVRNKNGEGLGLNVYLAEKQAVWFMYGGLTIQGRSTKAGYVLYWESIKYLKDLGYKVLDLEGKDDKRFPVFTKTWGGFSHFKEKFGGQVIQYPHPFIKMYNPLMKAALRMYGTHLPL